MDLYAIQKQLNMGVPLTNIKLRVTDYARVSTEHLEQKKSLKNQIEHFEKYIRENPNWTYVSGYVDDGISGTSDIKRENFMKMIEDARSGKFDLIITKEISRFSRNTLDSIKYTRELLSFGVAVFFVNDNINTALPDAELRLTIMASMSQDEIRRLSERVKFGMHRAIERGEILGNDMLFGYKKNKKTGKLQVIDEEARIVQKIYHFYAMNHYSLSSIAKHLNENGIRTNQGKKWCTSTISRMLENPKYKGFYCAKKSEVTNYMTKQIRYFEKQDWIMYEDKKRIPPIVTDELWDLANQRLGKRKKDFRKRRDNKEIYQERFLFSAKIYCGEDGSVFHRRFFKRDRTDATWVCSKYLKDGKKECDSPNLREAELLYILHDFIHKLQFPFQKIENLLLNLYSQVNIYQENSEQVSHFIEEKNRIQRKKEKLLDLFLNNQLERDEFLTVHQQYVVQLGKVNKTLERLQEQIQTNNLEISSKKNIQGAISNIFSSPSLLNYITRLVLSKIEVFKLENDKNQMQLNIYLNHCTNWMLPSFPDFLNYTFERGNDSKYSKKYSVFYSVSYYPQ